MNAGARFPPAPSVAQSERLIVTPVPRTKVESLPFVIRHPIIEPALTPSKTRRWVIGQHWLLSKAGKAVHSSSGWRPMWYNGEVPEVGIGSRARFLSPAERLVLHDSDRENQKRRHRGPH